MHCRSFARRMALAGFLLLSGTVTNAQIPQITLQTNTPTPGTGHDYIHELNETVDPSNGAVTIKINVPVPDGRQLSIPFYIMYSSGQVLSPLTVDGYLSYAENQVSAVSEAGWTYTVPMTSYAEGTYYDPNSQGTCNYTTDYVFFDAEGNGHTESVSTADATDPNGVACYAGGYYEVDTAQNGPFLDGIDADGTAYGTPSAAIFFPTGTTMNGQIEDRNGNLISINAGPCCNGAFTYSDTVGRVILSSSGFGSGTTTIQSSKFTNAYTVLWGTASYDYTVNITNVPSDPRALNCSSYPATQSVTGSVPAIQSITLPNSQYYSFTYDSTYGRISKVTYPSGAYVRYVWGMRQNLNNFGLYPPDGSSCVIYASEPVIVDRYVSPDGVTETEHQHFTYSPYYPNFTPSTTEVDTDLVTNQVARTITYNYTLASSDFVPFDKQQYGTPPFNESSVVYSSGSSTLRTVSKTWHNNDPRELASERTTLEDGSTASEVDYCYNSLYQVTEKDEFDYGSGSGGTTCNGTTAPGPLLRKTVTTYASFGQMSGQYPYLSWSGQWINDRPSTVITYDGSGNRVAETDYTYGNTTMGTTATSHDDTNYGSDSSLNRGNLVSATKQCFPGCLNATTSFTYDDTGQALTQTDPNGNVTHYSYADSFATGTPPGATDGFLTTITYPPTAGVNHVEHYGYNYEDGTLASSTDENSQITSYTYSDPLDRVTSASYPDGGETQYSYNDSVPITTTSTKKITSGLNLVETGTFDGLDREIRNDITNGESAPYDEVDTCYDGFGRVSFRSYTYQASSFSGARCSNDTTPGDSFSYDALDRETGVTHSDGSSISASYSLNSTTTTDEADKKRESFTDGLGRLLEVIEDPGGLGYATIYTYDALNDLKSVAQSDSRNRAFTYDSMARLISSTNPEANWSPANLNSVATAYSYDAGGNVLTKVEPAQNQQGSAMVTLSYCYDALNRMTSKAYTAQSCPMPSPVASYVYDGSALPTGCSLGPFSYGLAIGRRTAVCDSAGSEGWSYNIIPNTGWQTIDQRTTGGVTKTATYQDNLLGSHTSIQYPSGTTLQYVYNAGDRPTSATDGTTNYVTGAHYSANGDLCWATLGGVITRTETFNSRSQPNQMQASNSVVSYPGSCAGLGQSGNLLDLTYNFNLGSGDNGNVAGIVNNKATARSQSFMYDPLNRISQAQTASTYSTSPTDCWGETFLYDNQSAAGGAWGNLTTIGVASSSYNGCTQESLNITVDANNRINSGGFGYDTAGNLVSISGGNPASYSFNAENQMTQAITSSTTGYIYDGDGRRVEKTSGGLAYKLYWFDTAGNILEETDGAGNTSNSQFNEYIYFDGKRIARRTSN